MGKFLLYGLIVIGASSLSNWSAMSRSAGSGYAGGSRGGYIGVPSGGGYGGGWSSSGGGHK